VALLLVLALVACRKSEPAKKQGATKPIASHPFATPQADDPAWIGGTWEKQGGREWLLFNPPEQFAVLSGKPPTIKSRGKYQMQAKYVTLFVPQPNGIPAERYLEAAPDHQRLIEGSSGVWVRGAPP
jgi:hypothetical protein